MVVSSSELPSIAIVHSQQQALWAALRTISAISNSRKLENWGFILTEGEVLWKDKNVFFWEFYFLLVPFEWSVL